MEKEGHLIAPTLRFWFFLGHVVSQSVLVLYINSTSSPSWPFTILFRSKFLPNANFSIWADGYLVTLDTKSECLDIMSLPRNFNDVYNLSDDERNGVDIPRRIPNPYDSDLSRSKKYLSMSPSRYSPQFGLDLVDEKSVPRRLRHSKTVDINSKVSLDITNESKVINYIYFYGNYRLYWDR